MLEKSANGLEIDCGAFIACGQINLSRQSIWINKLATEKATFISVIGEQNLNRVGEREKRGKNRSKQFDAIFVTRVRRKIPLYRVDTQCIPLIAIIWVGPRPAKIRCAHVPGKLYQFH